MNIKKITVLFVFLTLVVSMAVQAQTISITLSGSQTGYLYYTTSDGSIISTQCWYRATDTTPGLSGLPWLSTGVYSGQLSQMSRHPNAIIITGNGITASRGIFIHPGSMPSHSDGCVVISKDILDRIYRDIENSGYKRNGGYFTIRVDR